MLSFLLIEIITVQSVPAGGMFQPAVFDHETLIDEIYGKLNSAWQTGRCNKDIAYRTLVKKQKKKKRLYGWMPRVFSCTKAMQT